MKRTQNNHTNTNQAVICAQKAKLTKDIPIGICGEIKYTEELLRKMKSIDYISTSMEKFLYTRVLSARTH